MAWIRPAASRGVRSTSTTSCKMSSGRSLHGRSGSGSRRWPPTALRRRICTLRFPRKRSRSRRKSLRRRSEDGPSDDDSGVAEPRNLEEDRRDSGGRRLHAGEARGIEARADRKSTRLNSSHTVISYAVFCLKKKKKKKTNKQKM